MEKSDLSHGKWGCLTGKLRKAKGVRHSVAQWRRLNAGPTGLAIGTAYSNVFSVGTRWSLGGEQMLAPPSAEADLGNICLDRTVVRAPACAAGATDSPLQKHKHRAVAGTGFIARQMH